MKTLLFNVKRPKFVTKINSIVFVVFFCGVFINCFNNIYAQEKLKQDSIYIYRPYTSKFEIGAEYLIPTRFSNPINTASIHAFFWKKYTKRTYTMLSVGVTATYAWGYSEQMYAISDSLYILEYYENRAFGMGPVLQIDPTIVKTKRFSLIAEATGGLIVYNKRFPYGGDIYNFMFRTGPSIIYKINNNSSLKIGYRWMHVSNGQGYGNQNPFYEAQGVTISFIGFK